MGSFNYFLKYGGVSVAETYILSFNYNWRRMGVDRSFEDLVKKYLVHWYTLPLGGNIDIIYNIVRDYDIDGVDCLALRSSKTYTLDKWNLKNTLERKYGIPKLILEMDMVDPRGYSDRQIKGRIDAFMQVLDKIIEKMNETVTIHFQTYSLTESLTSFPVLYRRSFSIRSSFKAPVCCFQNDKMSLKNRFWYHLY